MNTKKTITQTLLLFFLAQSISSTDDCSPMFCSPTGPQVRFPFRLVDRQLSKCGFPGFDLSCNKKNQTVLKLPSNRSYVVKHISYGSQMIDIKPNFCGPEKLTVTTLTNTPFDFSISDAYTFYNCSTHMSALTSQTVPMLPFPCLGSANHSVFALKTSWIPLVDIPASCKDFRTISVPVRRYGDIRKELTLMWFRPFCKSCEEDGKTCGFKSDDGETSCIGSSKNGIPRGAKYGLIVGIGVPALVAIFGLICYVFSKTRNYNHRQNIDLFSIAITPQPPSTTGLDRPTIESYPKILLGESCKLPNGDATCAICLSDYKPKEEVRSIPECNHYFHVDCIDAWLKLNATCPICRNSPETSSLVTPCSSMSSNSSVTTNSSHTANQQ